MGSFKPMEKGHLIVFTDVNGQSQKISLNNVLYLPEVGKNLLSVRAMTNLGAVIQFESDRCTIQRDCKMLGIGELKGRLYLLRTVSESAHKISIYGTVVLDIWELIMSRNCFKSKW